MHPVGSGIDSGVDSGSGLVDGLLGSNRTPALEAEAAFVYEAIGMDEGTILVRLSSFSPWRPPE